MRLILGCYREQKPVSERLGQHLIATYGSAGEGKERLGDVSSIRKAYLEMQGKLYE